MAEEASTQVPGFVAGDPGAKFGAAAPLEYEVHRGDRTSPLGVDL